MKAIQVDRPHHLRLVDVPVPRPKEGQVLLRNLRLSICGSDMHSFRQVASEEEYPFPPGVPCHECAGVVEESRAPGIAPGQRVIALPMRTGSIADYGGGAEYQVTDAARVIPLPPDGDLTTYIMCQPVGTVLFACQRMGSVLGKRVMVLGQGAIGLTFTHLLARLGALQVIVADLLDERLERARRQGATLTVNPLRDDLVGAVQEITGGQGADVVVEAAGTVETVNLAPDLVRRFGTLVLFGLPQEDVFPMEFMKLARKQPVVIPTVSAASDDPTRSIKEAVSLVAQGRLEVSWLVSHHLPFQEAPHAYEMYDRRSDGVVKVVMEV